MLVAVLATVLLFAAGSGPAGAADTARPVSDPVPDAAAGSQFAPAVAFGAGRSLVVWADERKPEPYADIYGARVDASGKVLDKTGFAIAAGPTDTLEPAVAFNGSNFLVTWRDTSVGGGDIHGQRVTPSGSLLGGPITIRAGGGIQADPTVTAAGSTWLVAWSGQSNIAAARVAANGTVLDVGGFTISGAPGEQAFPAAAYDGQNVVVTWQDHRNLATSDVDVYAARVSPTGTVLDPGGIPVSKAGGFQGLPSIASAGSSTLVVWTDQRAGSDNDVRGARISRTGTVLDPASRPISTAASTQYAPSVAWDGSSYLVIWEDQRTGAAEVFGRRVSSGGGGLGTEGRVAPGPLHDPHVAVTGTGTGFLAVFDDASDVGARRVGATGGTAGAPFLVSTAAAPQVEPDIAFDGGQHLAAWSEGTTAPDVRAARIGANGTSKDPAGIPIAVAAGTQLTPAVAFDGTRYLVVWSDSRGPGPYSDIFATRVTKAGVVLDPNPIQLTSAGRTLGPPDVAVVGGNFLAVWTDLRAGSTPSDVYGARVSGGGAVLDPGGFPIGAGSGAQTSPTIASAGSQALVTWTGDGEDTSHLRGARVTGAGAVVDPTGLDLSDDAVGPRAATVAFDGTRYLVAWLSDGSIRAARVRKDATVLDPDGITVASGSEEPGRPCVAANGHFLVVWRDAARGLVRATVDGAGTVTDPEGVTIAGSEQERSCSAAPAGGATFRLASDRFLPAAPFGATRVVTRPLS